MSVEIHSYGYCRPYLDILQYPQVEINFPQNQSMKKKAIQIAAERIDYLMKVTPSLDTNEKIAERSGIGTNTVRRIRCIEDIDPSIGKVEAVANAFGLTLAELVSEPGSQCGFSTEEIVLIHKLRSMTKKDQDEVLFFAASKAAINKMMSDQDSQS